MIKINSNSNGFTVEGVDNVFYPDNGTLVFAANTVIMVLDESEMVTFRSAANNDVLFSGLIGQIQIGGETVTKQNIIEKFDEVANSETGGDMEDYYTKAETDALLSNKADNSDLPIDVSELNNDVGYITDSALANYFDGAEYDSETKRINFKHGNTIKAYIDANAFIKDGMVDNVEITNGNLVITFNTDAGKQPISIPLTDIFNPNNYYTKTDADGLFATKVVVNEEIAARIEGDNALNTALGAKADKADTYTKSQVDTAIQTAVADYVLQSEFDIKEEVISTALNDLEDTKADKAEIPSLDNYYTKSEVDAEIETLEDAIETGQETTSQALNNLSATISNVESVTSQSLNNLNTNKQDKLTAGSNITIENNVISATGGTQLQSDWNQSDSSAVDFIKNKPTIPSLDNYYTKTQTDTAIETAIQGIDLSNYVDKQTFDTKEEVISSALNDLEANKQDALTAGANITIENNVISSTSEPQVQADWNQTDTTAVDYIKNKPTIPDTSDFVEKSVYNQKEIAVAQALTDLNGNKADKSEIPVVPDMTDYYTKAQTDTAIETALEDIDLSGYVDKATFDIKEEVISTALNDLDGRIGDINTLLEGI